MSFAPFGDNALNRAFGFPVASVPRLAALRSALANPTIGIMGVLLLAQYEAPVIDIAQVSLMLQLIGIPQRINASIVSLYSRATCGQSGVTIRLLEREVVILSRTAYEQMTPTSKWKRTYEPGRSFIDAMKMALEAYPSTVMRANSLIIAGIAKLVLATETATGITPPEYHTANVPLSPLYTFWSEG